MVGASTGRRWEDDLLILDGLRCGVERLCARRVVVMILELNDAGDWLEVAFSPVYGSEAHFDLQEKRLAPSLHRRISHFIHRPFSSTSVH